MKSIDDLKKIKIEADNPLPKYFQLKSQLIKLIIHGNFNNIERLPSDNEMISALSLSRATVRQAVAELCKEGFLYRKVGKGTYVNHSKIKEQIEHKKKTDLENSVIGLVIPNLNYFFAPVVSSIENICRTSELDLNIRNTDYDYETTRKTVAKMIKNPQIKGIIIRPEKGITLPPDLSIPVVLIDNYLENIKKEYFSYVIANSFAGIHKAYNYLLKKGHQKIAYLHVDEDSFPSKERLRAYNKAAAAYKANNTFICLLDFQENSSENVTVIRSFLEKYAPSAVICMNDLLVYDCLEACRLSSIKVPDDLAIIGYDNADFAARMHPPLTTVEPGKQKIGSHAIKLLLDEIEKKQNGIAIKPQYIELEPELIIRNSA